MIDLFLQDNESEIKIDKNKVLTLNKVYIVQYYNCTWTKKFLMG